MSRAEGRVTREAAGGSDRRPKPGRLISLDCFRGAIVAGMVLVNNPGDPSHVYSQLEHVAWHGMTFADVIASWFIWIIGITMAISLSRRLDTMDRLAVFKHVVYRAVVLYGVGVGLSLVPALLEASGSLVLENLKLMGILQRIALSYIFGSSLFLLVSRWERAMIAALLLVGYWVVMAWIPGPAMGTEPFAVDGNRAYILDRQIFEHFGDIGSHSLLTILPVTSTILLGTLAGDLVRGEGTALRRLLGLFAGGVGLCVVALFVSQWIPINRRLWTPSFALLTSGVAVLVFAALSWLLDVQRTRKGTEWLIAFGRNPIFLFVLSEVVRIIAETKGIRDSAGNWRSYWTVGYETLLSIADPKAASAIFALAYVISFGIVAVAMHRKGWIVKI